LADIGEQLGRPMGERPHRLREKAVMVVKERAQIEVQDVLFSFGIARTEVSLSALHASFP